MVSCERSFTPSCGRATSRTCWSDRRAHAMALDAHRVASRIRGSDHSSLRSQIIRSAMSVPANIVEGVGGGGPVSKPPENSAASYGLRSTRQRSSSTTLWQLATSR
ncbi:MAG: four helix bundle protein [Gemmatimonadaceae bacterium]